MSHEATQVVIYWAKGSWLITGDTFSKIVKCILFLLGKSINRLSNAGLILKTEVGSRGHMYFHFAKFRESWNPVDLKKTGNS